MLARMDYILFPVMYYIRYTCFHMDLPCCVYKHTCVYVQMRDVSCICTHVYDFK